MGFTKQFFDSFEHDVEFYYQHFETDTLAVTIKLVYGDEYNVAEITSTSEQLLSFTYYEIGSKGSKALPMMTVPFSGIAWVNVKPSKDKAEMGFKFSQA